MSGEGDGGQEKDDDNGASSSSAGDFLREVAFAPRVQPPGVEHDRTGERIGRFQLTALLGRGGMGVVYAARDLTLQRRVALKLLRPEASQEEERRLRLLREARAAAVVSHPNVAAVFDVGEVAGEIFIAMEYVAGRSLRAVLQEARGALPVAEALRIGREIARGLTAAHEAGVIHRDIKPENVMVCDDGRVKLLDFGLARLQGVESAAIASRPGDISTRAGRILGSPSYMSPEQARGLSADARSDVFALGVVLYEMLAGERPFRGATSMDVLAAIMTAPPPPLASRNADVSAALENVVSRCLEKDPSARYANAGMVLEALQPAESPPVGAPKQPSRRYRPLLGMFLLGGALYAILHASGLRMLPSPSQPPDSQAPGSEPLTTASQHRPTSIVDHPLPTSSSAEAVAAYKAALQSFRDANWGQARANLRKAVEFDPNLAAAQLRLAISQAHPTLTIPEARSVYREAVRLRNELTARDRALLTALEPALSADPPDSAATEQRLSELARRYPYDAEIFNLLAYYRMAAAAVHRLEAAQRAVELDPEYADAWQAVGEATAEIDPASAMVAFERCTTLVPTAVDCWGARARTEGALGRCAEAEAHFRRATSDPNTNPRFYRMRAHMLYALDKPRETVAEALLPARARLEPSAAHEEELHDRALLAAAYGDFREARAAAAEGLKLLTPLTPLPARARLTLLLTDIELETGATQAAAAVASNFLQRRDAWQFGRPLEDPTVYLTRVVARSGGLSEAELRARRDTWYRAARPATAVEKALVWEAAYVQGIEREDEAAEALAARPTDAQWSSVRYLLDAELGRALWLGGRREEALPHLARAFARCDRLPVLFSAMRTDLLFGRALEEQGERNRACGVYRSILKRWGTARPRSVTAEEASKDARRLRCDTTP